MTGAMLAFTSGCALTREQTTINTPAVYSIGKDAGGNPQTNLVSAASVSKSVKKERLWLPDGYAMDFVQSGYGVHFAAVDKQTGNPGDIKAGTWYSSQRWTPTSTNVLYAPAMSSSGKIGNKMPFTLTGSANFTSGPAQVQSSDTNTEAGAIVPGTPNGQQK